MNSHDFFSSKWFGLSVAALLVLGLMACSFWTGLQLGFHRAYFEAGWQARRSWVPMELRNAIPPMRPHAVFGTVTQVGTDTLTVKLRDDDDENTVRITANTAFRMANKPATLKDVTVGSQVVVIGGPNDAGEVDARLITISAAPPPAGKQ